MKKKIMTLLLAIGCAFSAGVATACSTGNSVEKQDCQHQNAHYILVENERNRFQPCIDCEDCIGFSWPEVSASQCQANVTEPTIGNDGYTIYTYRIGGKTYTSEQCNPTHVHDSYIADWKVAEGKTLCKDGGDKEVRCKNCDYVSVETVNAGQGHSSNNWYFESEDDQPTFVKEGTLTGICNACDAIVNGAPFTGCGEAITMKIPALNKTDYDFEHIEGSTVCGEEGKEKYSKTVYGQTISIVVNIADKKHAAVLKNGERETLTINQEILLNKENIAKYGEEGEIWKLFAEESFTCVQTGKAGIKCDDCERFVPVMIRDTHRMPSEGGVCNADLNCENEQKLEYICSVCSEQQYEAMAHEYTCELTLNGNNFSVDGPCANCPYPFHDEGLISEELKISKEIAPTCSGNGKRTYTYNKNGMELSASVTLSNSHIKHQLKGTDMDTSKTYDIPANGHSDYYVVDSGANPHCAQDVSVGYFYCDNCKEPVEIKVKVAHNWKSLTEGTPSCGDGETIQEECSVCLAKRTVPNESKHNWEYEYVTQTLAKYTLKKTCSRSDCGKTEIIFVDKEGCTETAVAGKESPTCEHGGTVRLSFKDGVETVSANVELPAKAHSTQSGVEKPYEDDDGNPIVYELKDGIEYFECAEGKEPCEDGSEAKGYFRCDMCDQLIQVRVEVEHTKPEDLDPEATEYECVLCGKSGLQVEE